MPGFLSLYNTPDRIEVAPGYWIEVKKSLTAEEFEHAQSALLGNVSFGAGGEFKSEPDTAAYQREIVFRSIVDWNLTDENDQPLPLTPDEDKMKSIMRLPQEVFGMVFDLVNETSGARSKDDEVRFRADDQVSDNGIG